MRRNMTIFFTAIALLLSGSFAAAKEPELLQLEGISLDMTADQVRAEMRARGNNIAGEDKDDGLKYAQTFQDLVSAKKMNPEKFRLYDTTSELRYETERGHLLVNFMPFIDRLVVVSARLYSNEAPWVHHSFPDCAAFMNKMNKTHALEANTDTAQGLSRYSSKKKPMNVNGQIKEDGQILRVLCGPRTSPQILLHNPHARDMLLQQIDQALSR